MAKHLKLVCQWRKSPPFSLFFLRSEKSTKTTKRTKGIKPKPTKEPPQDKILNKAKKTKQKQTSHTFQCLILQVGSYGKRKGKKKNEKKRPTPEWWAFGCSV
ncbi:MAG: hypothetical protein R2777_04170 [Chitinophagales bacterium]